MNARGIRNGAIGGLAGGMVFGMMMAMMGVLPMIGKMVGQPNAFAGFMVHMVISAGIGASFALLLGWRIHGLRQGLLAGMGYGGVWWILGPLLMMPWMMGMGFAANLTGAGIKAALPSLMGHLIYGLILGAVSTRLATRSASSCGIRQAVVEQHARG